MEIQFIDISTYQGICSDADHFYANVGEVNIKEYQESLVTSSMHDMTSFVCFSTGEELKYFPTEEEARALWQKDHGFDKSPEVLKYKEDAIARLQEEGTIRFPNIKSIVKAAVEKFPGTAICFSFRGDRKSFAKLILRMYESKNEKMKGEAIEILGLLKL